MKRARALGRIFWKSAGLSALVVVAGSTLVYGSMRLGLWNTDLVAMRAKYARPPSSLMTVDGVELHVRDEGRGPPVVMLHGSIANLHEWDPVAERLKARYRIVRLDWPPYGFSGPDPRATYTTVRAAELLAKVVDRLGLKSFTLVGTSNGGNVALLYAADHPDRVDAMAFSILPLVRPSQTRKADPLIVLLNDFHKAWLPDYHPKFWYWLIVKDTSARGFAPPRALVDMMYDADNLPGAAARQRAYIAATARLFQTTDVGALAAAVRTPVLLQWCGRDTVIAQSAAATSARFSHAAVQVIRYPDVGHFPMWEIPDRFSRDLAGFLDRVYAGPRRQA